MKTNIPNNEIIITPGTTVAMIIVFLGLFVELPDHTHTHVKTQVLKRKKKINVKFT